MMIEKVDKLLGRKIFEMMPFNIAVIDRDFNVITANKRFEDYFGNWQGRRCYDVYRGNFQPCPECVAVKTFEDGKIRVIDGAGIDRHGITRHYVAHLAPLYDDDGHVQYVIEMSTDLTETRRWQREYDLLFERVPCYITIIDKDFRITRANEKFRQAFGEEIQGRHCYQVYKKTDHKCSNCPAMLTFQDGQEHVSNQVGVRKDGSQAHYIVTTAPLSRGEDGIEHVIEIATDISEIKKLESEKLEAERLGAVGQTVAGLAHTIKNMLMGLEGGMYMVDIGLQKGDAERIIKGWDILQRNFHKTTTLVKDFLSFSKGRLPDLQLVDPNKLAQDIVELYRDTAQQQGVELIIEVGENVKPAFLDPNGMETCLTNLVSNGIDAAMLRVEGRGRVVLRTYEEGGELVFESTDNGSGMDWEVKQKVFTTFFTTKGGKGTGLGLLTTRKIVTEHGGRIEVDSVAGEGATFRIRLPRARLESLAEQAALTNEQNNGSEHE